LGLVADGIGLNFLTDLVHRLPTDPYFTGNFGTGLTFGHPTQHQHRLSWPKIPPFKDGAAIKIVNALALATPVNGQLTGLGLPKLAGLIQTSFTVWTLQPVGVKVFA
jgi:hypothetical protein